MMQRPIISQYVQRVEGHVSASARGANPKAPEGPAHGSVQEAQVRNELVELAALQLQMHIPGLLLGEAGLLGKRGGR
eukprot:3014116-Pyramimonas_sp.AAC.1